MTSADVLAILAESAAFASYSRAELASLAERSSLRAFRAEASIVRQGSVSVRAYLVVSGLVRVQRRHPDLTEPVVLDELGPGDLVGSLDAPDEVASAHEVVALQDTLAVEIGDFRLVEVERAV